MNKNLKWLLISTVSFMFFMGYISTSKCDPLGTAHWNYNVATFFDFFVALGTAISIFIMLIQTLTVTSAPSNKFWGVLSLFAVVLASVVSVLEVSKQYCH